MKLPLALAAALVLVGCATPASTENAPAAVQTEPEDAFQCFPGESKPLVWTPEEFGPGTTTPFTVVLGAETLELAWTPPTTAAGAWSVIVTDPDGQEVFAEDHGPGVTSGGTSVNVAGNTRSSRDIQQPPAAGDYQVAFDADGQFEGAVLEARVTGCW